MQAIAAPTPASSPHRRFTAIRLLCAAAVLSMTATSFAIAPAISSIRLECTADTAIHLKKNPSNEPIFDINYGAASVVSFHGIHYTKAGRDSAFYFLVSFDMAPVEGMKLTGGTLYLHVGNSPDASKLRVVSISTVATNWNEGNGKGTSPAAIGGGVTGNWAAFRTRKWAGPQSELMDASFSLGNTIYETIQLRHEKDGWVAIDISDKLVQALANGGSAGLAVFEEKGQTKILYRISTRESDRKPYLRVKTTGEKGTVPKAVKNLRGSAQPSLATINSGAAGITMLVGPGTSRVEISYSVNAGSKRKLPRRLTPLAPSNGGEMSVTVAALAPDAPVEFSVVAISGEGMRSTPVTIKAITSSARNMPAKLAVTMSPNATGKPVAHSDKLRVWAYGDCESAHPITANLLEEVGLGRYAKEPAGEYRNGNPYWNGREGIVTLAGCRNEIVAFHLLLESLGPRLRGIKIRPTDLTGPDGNIIPADNIKMYRQWYIRDTEWMGELCIPISDQSKITIPDRRNGVKGQRNQSFMVDIVIPRDIPAGRYRGRFTIKAGGVRKFDVPVEIEVWSPTLPDKLSFNCELNSYSSAPLDGTYDWYRLAHEHRATLNVLPYSQDGTLKSIYNVPITGEGDAMRVANWSAYDRYFGPLFDGSAFEDLPRGSVPLASQYLPFCEKWPLNFRDYYAFKSTSLQEHFLSAGPIDRLMSEKYATGFQAIAKDYQKHFNQKGWTHTEMQFYLNNKPNYTKGKLGFWCLDEPQNRDDFLAIRYWGQIFKSAMAGTQGASFIYRCDISRPHRQREWLDGLADLMCVSSTFNSKSILCNEMMKRGMTFYNYGSFHAVSETNLNAEAWPVSVYLNGGDGLLPWDTIGRAVNYTKPSKTAILLPAPPRTGYIGPVCSVRLKALRRGQQDVEYLNMLHTQLGYDREQIGALVSDLLSLKGKTYERFTDEAGETIYGNLNSEKFARLRKGIAARLSTRPE